MQQDEFGKFGWYVTFISIVFGVFISVWVEPMAGAAISKISADDISLEAMFLLARGLLMFAILVCLWWWYAIFLGKIAPANGFLMFSYDFTSLASFAIAFRMWDTPKLFSITVFIGALMMLVRFVLAKNHVDKDSKEARGMKAALFALGGFMSYFFGVFSYAFGSGGLSQNVINYGVMVLLIVGIIATIYAVRQSEGWKWGEPLEIRKKDESNAAV